MNSLHTFPGEGRPLFCAFGLWPSIVLAAMLASFFVEKACLSKVANPVSSSLGVSGVGSVVAVVGTAAVGCGDGVAAERLYRALALQTASLNQPMHAFVVLGEMAANACCKPVPKLAIGSSPTAPQTHLSDILRFYELYVKTGQGRVRNTKVRYPIVEEPKVKSSKPTPCILIGTRGNMTTCLASP